jgi:geranylgeranyl pyrophosphate synthase/uncharacterized protein with NAD-binding domain and iron-sulfur cluster
MSDKQEHILIFGAGIAGLTAAHELAERGFKVTIVEKEQDIGGKARSFMLPGAQRADQLLPGEHGFRFFLHWYENLQDTLRRIPAGNDRTVLDNLAPVDELLIDEYIFSFTKAEPVPVRPPLAWIKAMTACRRRHEEEFEATTWESYIEANLKDEAPEVITFFKNTPKATASVHCDEASVRALSYTLNRLLMNPGLDVLNGPTSLSWFEHWLAHLKNLGVIFHFGHELAGFDIQDQEIASAIVRHNGMVMQYKADHYLAAIPHQKLVESFTHDQLQQYGLGNLSRLKSGWQAGIVLYLKEPIHLPRGHFGFSGSAWAISGIQQTDFWSKDCLAQFTDPDNCGAILSLIIADWEEPGLLSGKPANACTLDELVAELKHQLIRYAPDAYRTSFERMAVLDYTIDPGVHLTGLTGDQHAVNDTPLFMNTVNSWEARPEAATAIRNFYIAGDFARTSAYLATMESANEAGRRAANSVLQNCGKVSGSCTIHTGKHDKIPAVLLPLIRIDEFLYAHNKKHVLDYFDEKQAEQFISNLMPYMQFAGGMLQATDGLYDNIQLLWRVMGKLQDDAGLQLTNLLFPQEDKVSSALADQINRRATEWAKVEMRLVDHMPGQFPDSMHAYIDTDNSIFKPLLHVTQRKGSMHRVQYAFALNKWYQAPTARISHLLETGQCIHNCSLLIDDVMDHTKIRRNAATANELFGNNQTLCAAYTAFFQVLISTYINLGEECLLHYLEESARAHIGQSEEIYFRERQRCPTEEKYLEIIANKTGSFFRVFALCLSAMSEHKLPPDVDAQIFRLADVIGLLFQVRDDYLDLTSEAYFRKKGAVASDFEEGKYSYPVVICLRQRPEYEAVFRDSFGGAISESQKYHLLGILKATGSLDRTLDKIRALYAEAVGLAQSIGQRLGINNESLLQWLHQMAIDTPGLDIPAIGPAGEETAPLTPAPRDPFDVSVLSYKTIIRAVRNVLCCRAVYFRLNGWAVEDFWKCFPLLVTVECMILNLDDQNETGERSGPVITGEAIEKSNSWQLIARSSFYTAEMDEILDTAISYYRMEHEWRRNKTPLLHSAAIRFMNHNKSTNFRILHLLSRNALERAAPHASFSDLEDYVSLLIEEREAAADSSGQIYNIISHSLATHNGSSAAFLSAYKKELQEELGPEQRSAAEEWFALYLKAEKYLATEAAQKPLHTSLKKIYAAAKAIADQCLADDDLSAFTLDGHFQWGIRQFFQEQNPFKSSDPILRRLQQDALLSLTK